MTVERDPRTRIVLSWLREAAHENAERVLLRALDEVDTTPQRRSRWPARRSIQMNRLFIAAGAAAVLVVAVAALALRPSSTIGPQGTPAPTRTPSPTVAPSPTTLPTLPSGTLAAGSYSTRPFPLTPLADMEVTLTVPSGWDGWPTNAVTPAAGPGGPDGGAIALLLVTELYSDPCRASTPELPMIPAGETVDDLVRAFGEVESSYEVGPVTDVSIGGYAGKQLDLTIPSDVDFASCGFGQYWIWDPGPYAQGPGNRWNVSILDVAGNRVVILAQDFPGTPAAVQGEFRDIIASITFKP